MPDFQPATRTPRPIKPFYVDSSIRADADVEPNSTRQNAAMNPEVKPDPTRPHAGLIPFNPHFRVALHHTCISEEITSERRIQALSSMIDPKSYPLITNESAFQQRVYNRFLQVHKIPEEEVNSDMLTFVRASEPPQLLTDHVLVESTNIRRVVGEGRWDSLDCVKTLRASEDAKKAKVAVLSSSTGTILQPPASGSRQTPLPFSPRSTSSHRSHPAPPILPESNSRHPSIQVDLDSAGVFKRQRESDGEQVIAEGSREKRSKSRSNVSA